MKKAIVSMGIAFAIICGVISGIAIINGNAKNNQDVMSEEDIIKLYYELEHDDVFDEVEFEYAGNLAGHDEDYVYYRGYNNGHLVTIGGVDLSYATMRINALGNG